MVKSGGNSTAEDMVRVFSVSSGKGGVGKSNVVINLAIAMSKLGKRVLILDADLGLANVDVLLGLSPQYNISHVLRGQKKISDILVQGPAGITIMPASSGVQELTHLSVEQKIMFLDLLESLPVSFDVFLIDTGAGISDMVLYFNLMAQEKIIVLTPEPTSLTDGYALIKVLFQRHGERYFRILVNNAEGENQAKSIYKQISKVADHFLDGISLDYIGSVPKDPHIPKAIMHQKAVIELFPKAPSSQAFMQIAKRLLSSSPQLDHGSVKLFWKKLLGVSV
ncbi:MAG: MinD/ParA family protein [Syntrophobacterales bacterium]|nr:MinD/ParA family protein [Syntrophobacterales bacterium]